MRGRNLVNLLRAVDLISRPQGATIEELGEHLEIDRRSVYRLKEVIEELGFPILDEKIEMDRKKRWKFLDTFQQKLPNITLPNLRLTQAEIIALNLLRGEEKVYKGTGIGSAIRSAFAKIEMFAPDIRVDQLKRIQSLFVPSRKHGKDYSGKEEIINTLTRAILQEKTCRVTYHAFQDDTTKSYLIDPLHFFENEGGLYIFVNTTSYGDIRVLALERIQNLEITLDTFSYPEDFDPEEKLNTAFDIVYDDIIEAKIRFNQDQARFIKERDWAADQKIIEEKDGSVVLAIKTSGRWDVKRWVLSFGVHAEVLEPENLREEIIAEIEAMGQRYG
ncbi:MAG: WYL domain-containing transcriptional regulator [Desulfobulbaceae bacterium]|nr:WYL domain-containing transcriptional regulator [Desulfobulbaceae bacterium]